MFAVEHRGNEDRINLGISLDKVISADAILYTHGLRASNHFGCALQVITLFKCIKCAIFWVKLMENVYAFFGIFKVSTEVSDWLTTSCACF